MDLDAYVGEHRGEWRRLAELSRKWKLSAGEADELVLLYQRVATQLSVVRSRTPDPALIAELSRLVLTARAALTGPAKFDWRRIPVFFVQDFPMALYQARRWWIAVIISFGLISSGLMTWVLSDPTVPSRFGLSAGEIERLVGNDFAGYYVEFWAPNFGFLVWVNNAWVAMICLAGGVLFLPPIYMLYNEAVRFGVLGGVMVAHGKGDVFFGLIAPHGMLELTAIFVAAGVGMRIGWSFIAPGPVLTRGDALAATAKQGMTVALGLVAVFAVAATLEAFVTPLAVNSQIGMVIADIIGLMVWLAFLAYVFVLGRPRANASDET